MQIVDIKTFLIKVPLKTPFVTALRRVEQICDLVVAIELADGSVGFGEAAPTLAITGESLPSMQAFVLQALKPRLIGRSLADFNALLQLVQGAAVGNSSAKAAVEIALYDARAKSVQLPLCRLLGASPTTLLTDVTISLNEPLQMAADAKRAVADGYQQLKLKLGSEPELDLARVIAVKNAVADEVKLRLDVNQAWNAKQSIFVLKQLEAQGIVAELVEQPVPAGDIAGLKQVKDAVLTPVMADESAYSPADVAMLLAGDYCDIINIKLMKTGGISRALQVLALCDVYHKPCMMGSMLESSVSVAAAAHLAAAYSKQIQYLDLDGPTLATFDPVVGGTLFDGPRISLNSTPGLGFAQIDALVAWPLAELP